MTSLLKQISCADDYDPESLSVARARQIIFDLVEPVPGSERLFVRNALGRVLAEDVISTANVPGHDNSAMDGYAVRFADLAAEGETVLSLAGTTFAGRAFEGILGPGQCVRIMTGGMIPQGADTVVIQEAARAEGERITVPPKQRQGQHVRHAGEDLRAGEPAIRAGKQLRPAELGLLASLGVADVTVKRRLRVAFFSTGDELCSLGTPLKSGEVYDSNRYTLFGMLTRLGCEVIDLGVVRDEPAALEAAFHMAAAQADAVQDAAPAAPVAAAAPPAPAHASSRDRSLRIMRAWCHETRCASPSSAPARSGWRWRWMRRAGFPRRASRCSTPGRWTATSAPIRARSRWRSAACNG